jgi:hypothetical protein
MLKPDEFYEEFYKIILSYKELMIKIGVDKPVFVVDTQLKNKLDYYLNQENSMMRLCDKSTAGDVMLLPMIKNAIGCVHGVIIVEDTFRRLP